MAPAFSPIEPTPRPGGVATAVLAGALGGATVGLVELRLGAGGEAARTVHVAVRLVAIAGLGYLALGALLAVPAALFVALLARAGRLPREALVACTGLGVTAGVGAFAAGPWVGTALLPVAVLGATAVLALFGPWLARGPLAVANRDGAWWGLAGLALCVNTTGVASGHAAGVWVALGLAAGFVGGVLGVLAVARETRSAAGLSVVLPAAALALLTLPPAGLVGSDRPRTEGPNVLLVTLDTLRADHVGCYGYERAKTPNVDRLAAEGALFENAISQANTTSPSHATMLSGLHPLEHGTTNNGMPLARDVEVLPEILAREGWATAASVSGFTLVDEACGLARRFDHYADNLLSVPCLPDAALELRLVRAAERLGGRFGRELWRSDRPAEETLDDALAWLDRQEAADPERPWFLWVHCYDPHAPYEPPPPFDDLFEDDYDGEFDGNWYALPTEARRELVEDPAAVQRTVDLYDGEIAYVDDQIGRLLERVDLGRTLVVLASDHGEGLGEHQHWFDHGTFLYDTELRVPLILRLPGGEHAGTRVEPTVRLLDLTPTVLDVLGLAPEGFEPSGTSLLPLLTPGGDATPRATVAMSYVAGSLSGYELDGRKFCLRRGDRKLIQTTSFWLDAERVPALEELYDLSADPGEQANLLRGGATPEGLDDLREELRLWRDLAESLESEDLRSDELRAKLAEIGYL